MGEPLTVKPWEPAAPAPTFAEYDAAATAWRRIMDAPEVGPSRVLAYEFARFRESILGHLEAFADDGAEVFASEQGEQALREIIARFRPDKGMP